MVINGHDSSENDANDEVKTEKIDSQEGNSLKRCLNVCNKKVLRLDKHIYINTNVESCHICNKNFNHKRFLNQHMRVHDSTKVQDGLNYFLLDNAYSKDVNDSNLKTFKCNYCKNQYKNKFTLEGHMKVEYCSVKYNENLLINCDNSSEKFTNFKSLMKHVDVHKKNDTYKCDNCDKEFLVKQNLIRHSFNLYN